MQSYLERLLNDISPKALFLKTPTFYFKPTQTHCSCNKKKLKVYKTQKRTIATLAIGECCIHETYMICADCKMIYRSKEHEKIVSHQCKFGFDVIVFVGLALFQQHLNDVQIQCELKEKNISLSIREIGYLGKKFIIYLALAHKESQEKIKALMQSRGGYILHLDGTCEGNSPHLMSSMDEITNIVIDNIKIPSENRKYIVPFLQRIKAAYGEPLALVHDMGAAILSSVEAVFPKTPDYICHFHFLRDIGKDLFETQYQLLARYLKESKVRTQLRKIVRDLKLYIDKNTQLLKSLDRYLSSEKPEKSRIRLAPVIKMYLLVAWVLEANTNSNGYGFPFDRVHLDFYIRLHRAYTKILRLKYKISKDGIALSTNALSKTINSADITNLVGILQERISVFEKLRAAMRIALPENNRGLNDEGDEDIKSIQEHVSAFKESDEMKQLVKENIYYKNMIKQIDKYWDKLFAEPIEVKTETGMRHIQPQRTNNIMERLFRAEKHGWRKKSGVGTLNRKLKAMLEDTPLVKNLMHPEYMKIILNGKISLAQRFAEIDIKQVREALKKEQDFERKYPKQMAKIFKLPDLPKILSRRLRKVAA